MNVLAITQARTGSTRLPNKILKTINGKMLLELHIDRIKRSKLINDLVVATTTNSTDNEVEALCKNLNINVSRGSENDVLDRFYQAALSFKPNYIVRLTSDCPLIDPQLIDSVIEYTLSNNLDYCTNTLIEHYPDGEDIEVFKFSALETAWKEADKLYMREHVTPFIRENGTFSGGTKFKSDNFPCDKNYGAVRLTVDEQKDLDVVTLLINKLGTNNSWIDYAELYLNDPDINKINSNIKRNEGFKKA